jgi:hypothetical protein
MSKVIDVRNAGGELVVLGKALVLPASDQDGNHMPLDGSIRWNPNTTTTEYCYNGIWQPIGGFGGGFPPVLSRIASVEEPVAYHVHDMVDITGLLPALDGKANTNHSHTPDQIVGLTELRKERIGVCVSGGFADTRRHIWVATQSLMFLVDFAGSCGGSLTPPSSIYSIGVRHNGVIVGSITLMGNTVSFKADAPVVIGAGQALVFEFPADPALDTVAFTLVGSVS